MTKASRDRARTVDEIEYELTLLSRHQLRSLKDQSLDRSAYLLLGRLELEEPMTTKELAEAVGLDVSTIHRQIGALLSEKLVEYVLDKDGGVARRIRPTSEGLARLATDRSRQRDGVGLVVADWEVGDLERLGDLLLRFNRDIEKIQGSSWPRPPR